MELSCSRQECVWNILILCRIFYNDMTNKEILEAFGKIRVCVIGDVMIDEYIFGKVERMSPEAPVPVVDVDTSEKRLGGAANVALNCSALGAAVTLASVVGNDDNGVILKRLLQERGIGTELLQASDHRKTTCKQRVISQGRQMMRIDFETRQELMTEEEHPFIDKVMRFLQVEKPDIVIFEDYNKGVLKANVLDKILGHCNVLGIPVAVDPKKDNFFAYKGVTIFKPNLKEIRDAFAQDVSPDLDSLNAVHTQLQEQLYHQVSFITLSENGVYVNDSHTAAIYPTFKRTIADVSGAGDTVIAVAALVYAVTGDMHRAARWSNLAGGIVCEISGVVPVTPEQLLEETSKHKV